MFEIRKKSIWSDAGAQRLKLGWGAWFQTSQPHILVTLPSFPEQRYKKQICRLRE